MKSMRRNFATSPPIGRVGAGVIRCATQRQVFRPWLAWAITLLGVGAVLEVAAYASISVCPGDPPECDYKTIQEAINAAQNGEIITVQEPGTYAGNSLTAGKQGITIKSKDPNARDSYIISGGGPVVVLGLGWVLEGFTIMGGSSTDGGGVTFAGTATIRDCVIHNNTASGGGGGVFSLSGSADLTVEKSVIRNNQAAYGGGISVVGGNIKLVDSQVHDNESAAFAGGIDAGGDLVIEDSQIYGNTVAGGAAGGILKRNQNRPVRIAKSSITGNVSSGDGAGLKISAGDVEIVGSVIAGNTAGTTGGGVQLIGGSVSFLGVAVTTNTSSSGGGGIHCVGGGCAREFLRVSRRQYACRSGWYLRNPAMCAR